jgi:hypothetical protein
VALVHEPTPRGGIKGTISHVNNPSSPFAKGGPRGILLSVRLPEDHHSIFTLRALKIITAYLLYEQSLTIPPAQQVGFESTKAWDY